MVSQLAKMRFIPFDDSGERRRPQRGVADLRTSEHGRLSLHRTTFGHCNLRLSDNAGRCPKNNGPRRVFSLALGVSYTGGA
jgi:hypothetical protein